MTQLKGTIGAIKWQKEANAGATYYLLLHYTVAMATVEGLCRPWTIATLI